MRYSGLTSVIAAAVSLLVSASTYAADDAPFKIQVVDEETGRGVPLVELETVNGVSYVTDSKGLVALRDPTLMGEQVFFTVRSHGYKFQPDGFGFSGKAVAVAPGESATLSIKRLNIAERLYRITGADIYRDSILLGEPTPIDRPLLNGRVYGSDSVVNTIYRGKIHWCWGDTLRSSYPLGNFNVPGAVSNLPTAGGLDPALGINLSYFTGDDGFARPVAEMPGDGPTWIDALVTLADKDGAERMYASYMKIKPPLTIYASGLALWNDQTERFDKVADFSLNAPVRPSGHPVKHTESGVEHVYFAKPAPLVRVRSDVESFAQLEKYEAFTCLVEGTRIEDEQLDRDSSGLLRYSWKRSTPPLDSATQQKLTKTGKLKEGEGLLALRDRETGKTVLAHGGSVYWNEFRKRWVMVFLEGSGTPSFLGEVWFAEADSLVGPWVYATKIATHDRYDFYNPKQHPMFDANGGRTIYFEGTYTNTFSGNPIKTPRYEYNQIMYRLQLDDSRLALPVAVYRTKSGKLGHAGNVKPDRPEQVAFFALDRDKEGAIPIYSNSDDSQLTTIPPAGTTEDMPVFYGLLTDSVAPPVTMRPLYEYVESATNKRLYSTDDAAPDKSFKRQEKPVCLVWQSPLRFTWEVQSQ